MTSQQRVYRVHGMDLTQWRIFIGKLNRHDSNGPDIG
jgi:hypothetical protein